ncbi:hypothetical protein EYF80_066910 [Liparis tanakae]|uniref:Uncharacterized protein n=1 Tax=Liparis tanakae TaxID=230148 RepID=A0A4Z2E2T5_9TELE|nr:hypothetical protein EYF80_066910 [Liparis tanakae]
MAPGAAAAWRRGPQFEDAAAETLGEARRRSLPPRRHGVTEVLLRTSRCRAALEHQRGAASKPIGLLTLTLSNHIVTAVTWSDTRST